MATVKELQAEVDRLKAEAAKNTEVSCKVGQKGGVSVYGMGRFPVTLYKEQWERLFEAQPMIEKFLKNNASSLKTKGN